jgi:hypothetical protein
VVYSSSELQSRWAAFEAPLPELMPGYQQGQPGNALLVLICYRESSVLVTLPPVEASIAERRELAAAVNRHHGATDAAPSRNHFFAIADKATVYCLDPTHPNEAPPKAEFDFDRFTMMAEAALSALTTPTTDEGLRGTFLEQDGELVDGVIAYDPPANPARQPDPNGTCFTVSSCQYPAGFVDDPCNGQRRRLCRQTNWPPLSAILPGRPWRLSDRNSRPPWRSATKAGTQISNPDVAP